MRMVSRFSMLLMMISPTKAPTRSIISSKVSSSHPTRGTVTTCPGFINPGMTTAIAPSATTSSSARTLITAPKIHRKRRERAGMTDNVRRTILIVCFTLRAPVPSAPSAGAELGGPPWGARSASGLQLVQSVRPLAAHRGQRRVGDVVDPAPWRGCLGVQGQAGELRAVTVQMCGTDPFQSPADLALLIGVGDVVGDQLLVPRLRRSEE